MYRPWTGLGGVIITGTGIFRSEAYFRGGGLFFFGTGIIVV